MNTFFTQLFSNAGEPGNGYKIYSYVQGTTTPRPLYQDSSFQTPHTNPLILDSAGRADVFLSTTGGYKLVYTDNNDVILDSLDNVISGSGSGVDIPEPEIGALYYNGSTLVWDNSFLREGNSVSSFNGRRGDVLPQSGDYTPELTGSEPELPLPTTTGKCLTSDELGFKSWVDIPSTLPPNGNAGGDLGNQYPNPSVSGLLGKPLPALDGNAFLKYTNSNWTWDQSTYQTKATNLDALSAAVGDGFFKRVSNVWTMDNTNYLTQNQSITVSGDVSGTGSTSIDTTVVGIRGYSVPSMSQGRLKYTVGSGLSWESKVPLSAGVTGTYPTITRGTTTISVGAFSAYLYPNSTFQGDPILYSFPPTNNINIPMVNDGTGYIIVDYFNGAPYVHLEYDRTVLNYSNKIPIAMVWNVDNTEVHFQSLDNAADGLVNKMQRQNVRTAFYQRDNVTGGLTLGVYTYSGPTYSLKPTITDGLIWSGGVSTQLYNYSANDGNKLTLVKLNSTGNYDYITTTDGSGIDNTHYNTINNQWLTMSANKYRKTFLFRSVGDALQCFYMVGKNQYNTVAEAESETMRYIPSILVNHCMYVGYIIIQYNVSTPVKIVSEFLNSGTSGGTVISDHTQLSNLNSTSYYHLTQTQYNDLTDGGSSDLHYHANMVVEGGVWP